MFVAHRVKRTHRRTLNGRNLPASVGSTRAVEGTTIEHTERPSVGATRRDTVRVVVVVTNAEEMRKLVSEGSHATRLTLGGRTAAGIGPDG